MLHLCYSVPAVHSRRIHSSQHNEPETSKRRLRGREREEDRGEGGRQKRKKQPRKKARKKRRTPKIPVFPLLFSLCHYSVIFPAEWASIIFSSQDINHFNLGTQKLQWFLIKKKTHFHICNRTFLAFLTAATKLILFSASGSKHSYKALYQHYYAKAAKVLFF